MLCVCVNDPDLCMYMYFSFVVILSTLIFRFNKHIRVYSPLEFLARFYTKIVIGITYNDNTIIVNIIHPTDHARLFRFIRADRDRTSIENQKAIFGRS